MPADQGGMGRFALAVLLLGSTLAASAVAAGVASVRWTHQRAERVLMARAWPDHRIVVGATCVGLDAHLAGAAGVTASRFSCFTNIFVRPPGMPLARWDAIGGAMRSNDLPRLYSLLGLPGNPTAAQVNAAAARTGLVHSRPVAVGLRVDSAGRSTVDRPTIPVRAFDASVRARSALFEAVPAIEAYASTKGTYAGLTLARLQAIDKGVSANVRIVSATRDGYCAEIGSGYTAWFARGPLAAPAFGAC